LSLIFLLPYSPPLSSSADLFRSFYHSLSLAVLFFFFLLILCAPEFTLFPYTTLFRSVSALVAGVMVPRRRPSGASSVWTCANASDRKSTRLNSSHVSISYAVFCLKKKNATTPRNSDALPSPHAVVEHTKARPPR